MSDKDDGGFEIPRDAAKKLRAFFDAEGDVLHPAVQCGYCGHFFDPNDKRSSIAEPDSKLRSSACPACAMMMYRGDEQWAVWNSCQGIFEVRVRRAEAEKLMKEEYDGVADKVVPVRVYEEQEDRHYFRAWLEHDRFGHRNQP